MDVNIKFLTNLLPEWIKYGDNVRQNKDISELNIHSVYEDLCQFEKRVLAKTASKKTATRASPDRLALVTDRRKKHPSRASKARAITSSSSSSEETESSNDSEAEFRELKEKMDALMSQAQRRHFSKSSSSSNHLRKSATSRGKEKYRDDRDTGKRYDDRDRPRKYEDEERSRRNEDRDKRRYDD